MWLIRSAIVALYPAHDDAPSVADLSFETFENLRYAGGLGIDLFTETAEIGRFAVATSPEGVRLLLTLGAPEGHGDRQHRE